MIDIDRIALLKDIDIFSSFSEEELDSFADKIDEIICEPGLILMEEGESGNDLFVLLQGRLRIYKNKRILSELSPVDYVGEMSIIESRPRSATVKVLEESRLLRVPAFLFQEHILRHPPSLFIIMGVLSQRIRRDNEMIVREFEQTNILIHDMKNLLSIFLFMDNFCLEKGTIEEKHLQFMKTARRHLTIMMEQALANVKSLVLPESFTRSSLQSLLSEMSESDFVIHPELKERKILIRQENDVAEFYFSRLLIRRVFLNVLINAAQASPPAEKIAILLRSEAGHAVIEVEDKGCGIAEMFKDKIFELHFTTKQNGNGLGLPSCKQIVEQKHGGTITFRTNRKGGVTFVIRLPLHQNSPW